MMIVLLTDFGQSEYVGVVKGVILNIDTKAQIVDLCHTISPQNLIEASWVLKTNYAYFPRGAIFCCVVDPGVGSDRRAIVVRTEGYTFVAPDNGLLWETLRDRRVVAIHDLPIPAAASRTFHGRDVFAQAAAHANLSHFLELGNEIEEIKKLQLYRQGRDGIVVRVDHFGNMITNLPPLDKNQYAFTCAEATQELRWYPTYAAAPADELFLVTGSNRTLEISLKNDNAAAHLNLAPGQKLSIA